MSLLEKILGKKRADELAEREEDKQYVVNARARRRYEQRWRSRRQRKGQRRFTQQQLKGAFHNDTVRAQMHVLETRQPGDPMYDNVYNALLAKYGPPE